MIYIDSMAKDAIINARVESKLKKEVEKIFTPSAPQAANLSYKLRALFGLLGSALYFTPRKVFTYYALFSK